MKEKTSFAKIILIFSACLFFTPITETLSEAKEFHSRIFVEIVKEAKKSVVSIQIRTLGSLDLFSDKFGGSYRYVGNGFFVDKDGLIMTNKHVVEKGTDFTVKLSNGETFPATLLFKHPTFDLALLKMNDGHEKIYPLKLGDSSRVEVGEWVLAIGNPFGLYNTVTMGIVSAIGREDITLPEGPSKHDLIQTDAAINPGNSGGPLINLDGEAIGINSMIFSPGKFNIGISLSIPINVAKEFLENVKKQKLIQGWIGVYFQKIEPEILETFKQPKNIQGALVSRVEKNSPAEKSGLKQGDVITHFNGSPVSDHQKLAREIENTDPGQIVVFDLLRRGESMKIKIAVEKRKEEKEKRE